MKNNDLGLEIWIKTILQWFKIPTNMVFGLLIDKVLPLKDNYYYQLPVQYVRAMMYYDLGYNIVNIAN